jgi:hypothetical protein
MAKKAKNAFLAFGKGVALPYLGHFWGFWHVAQ